MVGDHALAGVKVCILESVTSIIIFIKNMAACDPTTQAAIFFITLLFLQPLCRLWQSWRPILRKNRR